MRDRFPLKVFPFLVKSCELQRARPRAVRGSAADQWGRQALAASLAASAARCRPGTASVLSRGVLCFDDGRRRSWWSWQPSEANRCELRAANQRACYTHVRARKHALSRWFQAGTRLVHAVNGHVERRGRRRGRRCAVGAEDVAVQRVALLVHGRLAPPARVVPAQAEWWLTSQP